MIFDIIGELFDEAVCVWQDAKHDWKFAKKQMDQIQGPSLYKEED